MNLEEAVEILRQHNLWRRDRNEVNSYEMQNPIMVGLAIDRVVDELAPKLTKEGEAS